MPPQDAERDKDQTDPSREQEKGRSPERGADQKQDAGRAHLADEAEPDGAHGVGPTDHQGRGTRAVREPGQQRAADNTAQVEGGHGQQAEEAELQDTDED